MNLAPRTPSPTQILSMSTTSFTKKILGADTIEPALTPPPASDQPPRSPKKPKLGGTKSKKRDIPEGLWTKCPKCETMIFDKELDENLKVCAKCEHHFPIGARERIHSLVETCTFEEMDAEMISVDVLKFTGVSSYTAKLAANWKNHQAQGRRHHRRRPDRRTPRGARRDGFQFPGRLDGVGGRRKTHAPHRSRHREGPARHHHFHQRRRAHVRRHVQPHANGQNLRRPRPITPRPACPTSACSPIPTTAGVMASYASVGDLILAEPGAMIGFAGPRVIKDTTQAELPPGFQTAEFLLDHGLIDAIVPRKEMKERLIGYLDFMMAGRKDRAATATG